VINSDIGGYHQTITLASPRGARSVLDRHGESAPLHAVANDLLAGELGQTDWLLLYWSRMRLFSAEARGLWTGPDLQPLPF
jgi:hypothetical protein